MAKQKEAEQTTGTDVVIFQEAEAVTLRATAELVSSTIGTEEALDAIERTYGQLMVNGIEDMAGYSELSTGLSKLRTIRTTIEKRRKELTEPALTFQRRLKEEADRITARIVPIEESLKKEKLRIDDVRETARRAEFQRRIKLLTETGWQLVGGFYICGALQIHPDDLIGMDEQRLEFYLEEGRKEVQRKAAEEQRKAQEQEQLRAKEESLRLEREKLDKERAEFEAWKAKQEAELGAQKEAIEQTYETVVQPPAGPGNIQDAGARAQERSQRLLLIGMKFDGQGFIYEDINFHNTDLLCMEDEAFETAFAVVAARLNPGVQPAFTVAEAVQKISDITDRHAVETPVSVPTSYGPGYMLGFDNFRLQLIDLLSGEQKYTRAEIITWAKNLKPKN